MRKDEGFRSIVTGIGKMELSVTHIGVLERHGVLAAVHEEYGDDAEEGQEHCQTRPRPLKQQVPEPPHWRHEGTKETEETYKKGSLIYVSLHIINYTLTFLFCYLESFILETSVFST